MKTDYKDGELFYQYDLDHEKCDNLKALLRITEKNMLRIAELCYLLKKENEPEFYKFVNNELNMSKGTVSKFLTVGTMICNLDRNNLPDTYTKIYALAPVKEQMKSFAEYAQENEVDIKNATVKKLNETVHDYLYDGKEPETKKTITRNVDSDVFDDSFIVEFNTCLLKLNTLQVKKASEEDFM